MTAFFSIHPSAVRVVRLQDSMESAIAAADKSHPKGFAVATIANLAAVATPILLEAFNFLQEKAGSKPISRFSDRAAAERRTMEALTAFYKREVTEPAEKKARKEKVAAERAAKTAERAANRTPAKKKDATTSLSEFMKPTSNPKGINLNPKDKVHPAREGSKQAKIIDLMARKNGVTFRELYEALQDGRPWSPVTVRSGLSWDVNYVKGYGIRTEHLNGDQFAKQGRLPEAEVLKHGQPDYDKNLVLPVYFLTYPAGQSAPVPHTQRKTKVKEKATV